MSATCRRHAVRLVPGGAFARILGTTEIEVNSLHWQGVDRLADGLSVEGTAPDGTIEAVASPERQRFRPRRPVAPRISGAGENPSSVALFQAFGDAARAQIQASADAADRPGCLRVRISAHTRTVKVCIGCIADFFDG